MLLENLDVLGPLGIPVIWLPNSSRVGTNSSMGMPSHRLAHSVSTKRGREYQSPIQVILRTTGRNEVLLEWTRKSITYSGDSSYRSGGADKWSVNDRCVDEVIDEEVSEIGSFAHRFIDGFPTPMLNVE
jgi:hypothetical protein